jgi:hypothetical protein
MRMNEESSYRNGNNYGARNSKYDEYSINSELIMENQYGSFQSIDIDESIAPYSRLTKGRGIVRGKGRRKKLQVIEESKSESSGTKSEQDNVVDTPVKRTGKFEINDIEEAMYQNSANKDKYIKVSSLMNVQNINQNYLETSQEKEKEEI